MQRLTHKRESGMKSRYWSPNKKQEQPEGIAIVDIPSEPELYEEVSEKTDIDIAREENQKAQMYLELNNG